MSGNVVVIVSSGDSSVCFLGVCGQGVNIDSHQIST